MWPCRRESAGFRAFRGVWGKGLRRDEQKRGRLGVFTAVGRIWGEVRR